MAQFSAVLIFSALLLWVGTSRLVTAEADDSKDDVTVEVSELLKYINDVNIKFPHVMLPVNFFVIIIHIC